MDISIMMKMETLVYDFLIKKDGHIAIYNKGGLQISRFPYAVGSYNIISIIEYENEHFQEIYHMIGIINSKDNINIEINKFINKLIKDELLEEVLAEFEKELLKC